MRRARLEVVVRPRVGTQRTRSRVSQNPSEAQRLGSLSLSAERIPSGFGRLLMALRDRDKALSDVLFRQAFLSMRSNGFAFDPALTSLTNYAFFSNGTRFPDISPLDAGLIIQYFVDAAGAQAARARSGSVRNSDEQSWLGSFYNLLNNRVLRIVDCRLPISQCPNRQCNPQSQIANPQ